MTTDYFFPDSIMRAFIGADHLRNRLNLSTGQATFPPHNIEQIDTDVYVLSLALAGYSQDDVNVSINDGNLTISSEKEATVSDNKYLHRGISFRNFSRQFVLGEHIHVADATMENGLLKITLERVAPEESKPKRIPITTVRSLKHEQA